MRRKDRKVRRKDYRGRMKTTGDARNGRTTQDDPRDAQKQVDDPGRLRRRVEMVDDPRRLPRRTTQNDRRDAQKGMDDLGRQRRHAGTQDDPGRLGMTAATHRGGRTIQDDLGQPRQRAATQDDCCNAQGRHDDPKSTRDNHGERVETAGRPKMTAVMCGTARRTTQDDLRRPW